MDNFNDIKYIFYINLDRRTDRKECIEQQLKVLNWQATRFPAILHKNGAIGCSLSHLALLKYARGNNLEHILILEDDVTFLKPALFLNNLNNFLHNRKDFDVLLLAGNNMGVYEKIDESCVKVTHCQTTTAYLVKKHYYNTLIHNFERGIYLLNMYPNRKNQYAIDEYWCLLQKLHKWYLLTPLTIIQRPDISDIEKCHTNYSSLMLILDKSKFKRNELNFKTLKF
jgi:GR25 family glycosyltransferase involved in LPS biosynthesis